ncbi:MAG: 2-amino-4-hydroxy-6-hydroxymethyldihydropteridine diphosphokinase, partial [Actinobacteria bacterium]|nr:2-amino-4-hydroxy-6-hydroxymethyldihydropteridine diphosphokinase [Actinomycetota bacterium]
MGAIRAYIGLGGNVGDRVSNLERAVAALESDGDVDVVAVSTLRETEPVGYRDQPPFLNGVVAVETALPPRVLLDRLLAIE